MKVLWYNVLACGLSPRMILHKICFPCTKSGMWLPKPLKVIKHFQKKKVVLTETPCFNFLADLHRINEFFLWILRTSLCLSLLKIYLMNHHMAYCKYALFFFIIILNHLLKEKKSCCIINIPWIMAILEPLMSS